MPKHTTPPASAVSAEGCSAAALQQAPSLSNQEVSNKSGREALRGAEVHTLDLIFEALTSEQLAEMLRAPLQRAAATGNRDLALRLVRAGASEIGDALQEATEGGHGEIVGDLVKSGVSLATKGGNGWTALHVAARQGQTEMVQLLLLNGADKDAFDNQELTPLFWAAHQGHVAAALALLAAGADVSLRCDHSKTPVMFVAAQEGHVEILRAVIEHGAGVNAVDIDQNTALHAAAWNKAEAIDVLLEAGANIEAPNFSVSGSTPLHYASYILRREALLSLLKHGAAVNARDRSHQTPLMCAASKAGTQGAAEVVDGLLRAGADETMVNDDGRKASDLIVQGVDEEDRLAEDVERVRELLANAPADRAWRRRGYLVLCRAHSDRVQHSWVFSGTHHTGTAWRTRSRAKRAREAGGAEDSGVDESTGGDWAVAVAKVLQLQEEGIFWTIVGYM